MKRRLKGKSRQSISKLTSPYRLIFTKAERPEKAEGRTEKSCEVAIIEKFRDGEESVGLGSTGLRVKSRGL